MRYSSSGPRLLGNRNYYNIKLGKEANISVKKDDDIWNPYWKLVYFVDGMTSTLDIFTDKNSGDEILNIVVHDCRSGKIDSPMVHINLEVQKGKKGLLYPSYEEFSTTVYYDESLSGGVKTQIYEYEGGTRKGLLVTESNEKQPYMVTVAHYYVNSGSGGSGTDIGFSVVVKVGVVNGGLDYNVDGPVEHPTSALVYMIEEVVRTVKWKPSACPHCKNILSQQRRWVSDSEDSDTNLPTPPSYGGQQNASNIGRFNGDGIGSMIRANNVNFNKWWR
ncbi:uncharacterized protein LOC106767294 [Vigna radiata var. radiata]|uniref:Uncharacterized protein LOC106767294 n=1 Tax=Vigna radiata var. radiata TaxID=3916 RepID=A0A1S3UNR8_VIGRR|nr:uncharacterized protein LOC106767294 [Vigna radiata var. radiata]XP_022632850.1 uncharacterized protein LOC106767294 [Vigna radiata var. radiata]